MGCSPWGREDSDTTERLPFHFSLACIGEGNGKPLQYSCLENLTDRGTLPATVHGVAGVRHDLASKPPPPKDISPEYSLEGLMLKLKLRYFGHLIRRADSFEKTLIRKD